MKSMTAKMRQAAKNEHHKFEFDENSGKVFRKDELEDLGHMKGLSDREFVFELFHRKELQEYMHKHYQIIPILINRRRIRKFANEL